MTIEGEAHPYVPQDLKFPGFVPIFLSQSHIVGFVPKISKIGRVLMCWWIFTGLTHMVLEGYFIFTPDFYKKTTPVY